MAADRPDAVALARKPLDALSNGYLTIPDECAHCISDGYAA
jgi:hypothetical protein